MFESLFTSVMWSAADVAARNLNAGSFEVTLITMAPGVALLLALLFGSLMDSANRRQLFVWPAMLGRLPIVFILFSGRLDIFIGLLFLQALSMVPITAAFNSLLRINYRREIRGGLFAKGAAVGHLSSGIAMLFVGSWLDNDPDNYRMIYPAVAVMGVIACFIFARMPVRDEGSTEVSTLKPDVFYAFRLLARDRLFLIYEAGFFLYGLGFMMLVTAKPLFAAHELELSNKQMLGARSVFSLLMVLGTPFMGRLMDRFNPAGLAGLISFPLLSIYALSLYFVNTGTQYLLVEVIFGAAMAGVLIAWNIGPVSFASARDATRYMGVHVALVGVRALIGHPVGGWIAEYDPRIVFPISALLLLGATFVMVRLRPRLKARLETQDS